jgi:farnesyl diphosphate synthase
MAKQTTLKEFESVWPKLEEAILDKARAVSLPERELEWFQKVSAATVLQLYSPAFG